MDFYGNDNRKNRCDDLLASLNAAQLSLNEKQKEFEAKSTFYHDITLAAARAHGYPTLEALEADIMSMMTQVDRDEVVAYKAGMSGLTTMHSVVGSLAFVATAAGTIGQVRMKRKYGMKGADFVPWRRFDKISDAKVLKAHLFEQLTVAAPRELKVKKALKRISDADFASKMGDLAKAAALMKASDAANFAAGGKFADTAAALGSAKLLSRSTKFLAFLEIGGMAIEVAAIVAEAIAGAVMRDKLREAIKQLAAQRFLVKQLQMMGNVWDSFNNQVSVAVGVWVENQQAAVAGDGCYLAHDEALLSALSKAYVAMDKAMVGICDCAVYKALAEDDISRNSWTNEDPTPAEIAAFLADSNYVRPGPNPVCPEHFPDANTPVPPNPDATPDDGIYPPVAASSQVTAANCRYVELTGGKGALWRVRGGFWTLQEPLDTNYAGAQAGLVGPRLQLYEWQRTADKIYLQNISNWKFEENVANWVAPAGATKYPYVVLDFADRRVKTLPSTTNITVPNPPAGAAWGAREMDPASYCNLTKINGWTLYYAPSTLATPREMKQVHECSQISGWELEWLLPKAFRERLYEQSRSLNIIQLAVKDRDDEWYYPKVSVDVANKKISYVSREGKKAVEAAIETTTGDLWMARKNYT